MVATYTAGQAKIDYDCFHCNEPPYLKMNWYSMLGNLCDFIKLNAKKGKFTKYTFP